MRRACGTAAHARSLDSPLADGNEDAHDGWSWLDSAGRYCSKCMCFYTSPMSSPSPVQCKICQDRLQPLVFEEQADEGTSFPHPHSLS